MMVLDINLRWSLREWLADLEHKQWAHWTKYMLDNLTEDNIKKWRRQIDTPFEKLSEQEKKSDFEWADKVIDILTKFCIPDYITKQRYVKRDE
jgi:hypothetical protein